MKLTLLILTIFLSALAVSQEHAKVVSKYKRTERMGNFITRWYYDIIGTSLLFEEELVLFDDSTFSYYYVGGECGTFDTNQEGYWIISNDTLRITGDQNLISRFYLIKKNKLYSLNKGKDEWVLKKVK
ncbi:hypothetical protein LZF95_21365 [Algoriphagus sp. AGSA1]|uniref:hypothetical protein n=1 Tax=Algoriphagus sp. AGSA1 TaxID=2907213 RepID=UPI001F323E63|nr:hypothetical protein [Algoriphagus sp. AGSA1]MCE7057244.1 hypothetical protein [Algoriphagus sp. AGSA1]